MTVPSQVDIKKREDKLKEFMKRLNEDGSPQENTLYLLYAQLFAQLG